MRRHVLGVAGVGMSALAVAMRSRGEDVTGSDRLLDSGGGADIRRAIERAGVRILPESAVDLQDCAEVVVSTAIEASHPVMLEACRLGVPVIHRSEALARLAQDLRTTAVAGTSGKSTTTALLFHVLRTAGMDPSLVTGAPLRDLQRDGGLGSAYAGTGPDLVLEADESDGSLVHYRPYAGILLNIERDHKEISELEEIFSRFRERTSGPFVVPSRGHRERVVGGSDSIPFGFGTADVAHPPARIERLGAWEVEFALGPHHTVLPLPGEHNASNALAALVAAHALGVDWEEGMRALPLFGGLARRFERLGEGSGYVVVDDYAHNPSKIAACLRACRRAAGESGRVEAVFRPHGYGPLRFMLHELAAAFIEIQSRPDRLWILPVFDAGGTADRTVDAGHLADAVTHAGGPPVGVVAVDELPALLAQQVRGSGVVVVMGARDPGLTTLGLRIVAHLRGDSA